MMELTKENKRTILYTCALFCLILYGMGLLGPVYQPDNYLQIFEADSVYAPIEWFRIRDGRPLMMALIWFLRQLSYDYTRYYYVSLVLSIALSISFTSRYGCVLAREIENRFAVKLKQYQLVLVGVLSCLIIANLFSAEYYLYVTMMLGWMLAIWLTTDAAIKFIDCLSSKAWKIIPVVFLELIAAGMLYELIVSIFIILTVPFVLVYSADIKSFFINQIIAGAGYVFAMIVKVLITIGVSHSSRATTENNTIVEAVQIYTPQGTTQQQFILDRITFGMWIYSALCLIIALFLIIRAVKRKEINLVIKGIYIAVLVVICGMIPYIIRVTDDISPRIYYPLGCMFGIIVLYGILIGYFDSQRIWQILVLSVSMMSVAQCLSFVQMYTEEYMVNYEDKYISRMIGQYIDDYEILENADVEYVVFYNDAVRTKYIGSGWCIDQRAFGSWGNIYALNYYLNRDYSKGSFDPDIAEYFSSRDWDVFSYDQIIVKDNTAHICMY